MARSKSYLKSGALTKRSRFARKLRRDREIYRSLRLWAQFSERIHLRHGEEREPLSVYVGKPDQPDGDKLSPKFPMTHQKNGRPMPAWEDLTPWLKAQLLVMGFHEWGLQTFTVHLRSDLEAEWTAKGKDPRVEIRNRFAREMRKVFGLLISVES